MTTPDAQPASEALLDLAAATRPDIDRGELQQALAACHSAGWPWPRTLVETARMLARGEDPRDLIEATKDPLKLRRHAR